MRVLARFNIGGQETLLDEETGMMPMAMRGRLDLLKHRMDKQGRVCQQKVLGDGNRETLPALLEVETATLAGLLDAVEKDEARLRGPLVRNSHLRTIRRMNPTTGLPEYETNGVKHLDTGRKI